MYILRPEFTVPYSRFLQEIRNFFQNQDFIEVETPLLYDTTNIEIFIKAFSVDALKSPAYLITSPEFALKSQLAYLKRNIYQIAHCFRNENRGPLHMQEFLMLEWYFVGANEFQLMKQCEVFLQKLARSRLFPTQLDISDTFPRRSVASLLEKYAQCTWERVSLEKKLEEIPFVTQEKPSTFLYEDLFFLVFLHFVEPHLGKEGPEFVYHYPPKLSAYSVLEKGFARRFELYWNSVEIANAYYELRTKEEYIHRFEEQNKVREKIGEEKLKINQNFIQALEKYGDLPEASGIALGLDRLFMMFLGYKSLLDLYIYTDGI